MDPRRGDLSSCDGQDRTGREALALLRGRGATPIGDGHRCRPSSLRGSGELSIAAGRGATGPRDHFNGKIDSPRLIADALPIEVLQQLIADPLSPTQAPLLVAAWDFSRDMGSEHVVDLSPNRLHGRLVDMPGRAMKGVNWSGAHQNWAAAPASTAPSTFMRTICPIAVGRPTFPSRCPIRCPAASTPPN